MHCENGEVHISDRAGGQCQRPRSHRPTETSTTVDEAIQRFMEIYARELTIAFGVVGLAWLNGMCSNVLRIVFLVTAASDRSGKLTKLFAEEFLKRGEVKQRFHIEIRWPSLKK